jgi:Mrp family chromosome partitioning ATPase
MVHVSPLAATTSIWEKGRRYIFMVLPPAELFLAGLIDIGARNGLNTVAIVSAGAGEGKSTTVFNLAAVFAQSGQRTLIVDSDLRRPTLHKMLHVTNSVGLTNYLLKQNTEAVKQLNLSLEKFGITLTTLGNEYKTLVTAFRLLVRFHNDNHPGQHIPDPKD